MDVALVRWPAEDARRCALRVGGIPRLLLVPRGSPPPQVCDDLEDWVRVPADQVELRARVENLQQRARARVASRPWLDDGVLRVGRSWVALTPVEARLAGALVERAGSVVSRAALAEAGWPDGTPGRNSLDVHMLRLRRRIAPLGLSIRTVRSRGYALE